MASAMLEHLTYIRLGRQLLQASINTLLNRVGIEAKPINSFEELRKSASSMFVAIFEAMFQVCLPYHPPAVIYAD